MKNVFLVLLILSSVSAQAQFSTGTFTDPKTKTAYRYVTVGNLDWMQDDVTVTPSDTADVQTVGQRFIKKNAINKYCPAGWRLPTLQEVRQLIAALEGEKNSTGGKTVDSTYLQKIFPFALRGFYYTTRRSTLGNNYMTAYYTATDTLWSFSDRQQIAQVAIHIYQSGKGKVNLEPTFSKDLIYCRLRFVRENKSSGKK
jgi:uncharacterized protein (TIGR02145 family)